MKQSILNLLNTNNIINWQLATEMIGFDKMFDIFFDELNSIIDKTYSKVSKGIVYVTTDPQEYKMWCEDPASMDDTIRYGIQYKIGLFNLPCVGYDEDVELYFVEFEFNKIQYVLNIRGDLKTCRIPIYNILKEII